MAHEDVYDGWLLLQRRWGTTVEREREDENQSDVEWNCP